MRRVFVWNQVVELGVYNYFHNEEPVMCTTLGRIDKLNLRWV